MDVYEELGIRKVINARGTYTFLGGSVMPPEVVEAWVQASKGFVYMRELHRAAGGVIANIMHVDMGMVTAGCAAAMATAAAACIVKRNDVTDPDEMRAKLPHSEGLVNQFLIPVTHRCIYDQAFEVAGGRLIEFGDEDGFTDEDLEEAITAETVGVVFILRVGLTGTNEGLPSLRRVCTVARRYSLPVIVDAAAEVPPRRNFQEVVQSGADLICYSGGKDIMGPNDTGFLFGQGDLMEIAHANLTCPNHQVVRAMKVGKEDIVAAVAALKRYVAQDEEARYRKWEDRIDYWMDFLSGLAHVRVARQFPEEGERRSQGWPRALVTIDERGLGTTVAQVVQALAEGDPPILVEGGYVYGAGGRGLYYVEGHGPPRSFSINPHLLTDEEVEIVACRVKEVLVKPPPAPVVPTPPTTRQIW